MTNSLRCSVAECTTPIKCKGMCEKHYRRMYRRGSLDCRTPPGTRQDWMDAHKDHVGDECLLWPFSKNGSGYGVVWVDGKQTSAQNIMCRMAYGDPPTHRHQAAHSCGRGRDRCINPRHLRWATRKENCADQIEHGTAPRGENQGGSKLTKEQVREILSLKGIVLQRELAVRYGISQSHVSRIQRRGEWAWLT